MSQVIELVVNGEPERVTIQENWTLLQLLRQGLSMLGTEEGCGEGSCGSCSVIVDGRLVRACLYLAVRCAGTSVQTVEGLAEDERLAPIQQAFVDCGAIQCGFCTPGFLMVSSVLLDENPEPTEHDIREGLSGNLCRCGGYPQILEAVQTAVVINRERDRP